MLRACAIQYGTSWDKSLPYAEFSYNNSYQASIKMLPFQALYGRRRRTPLHWDQPGEKQLFGPEIIEDAKRQVRMIRENLRTAQTRQKSYADHRRRDLEFAMGDYVYLKVSPIRGLRRFKVKGKLASRYIGPFKIIDRKGEVAYQLELPDRLSGVHDVFHVSQLKKCLRVDELNVQDDLTYTEYPVQILETVVVPGTGVTQAVDLLFGGDVSTDSLRMVSRCYNGRKRSGREVSLLLGLCALCGVPCSSALTLECFPSFYSSRGELTVLGKEEGIQRGGGTLTCGSPCYNSPVRCPCVPGTPLSRAMRSSVQGPVAELCRGFGVPANASILTESESRMGRVFRPVRPGLLTLAFGVRRAWC
ncbi:hypothetical protein U9M48_004782 [Paspalum notatum var. saurae]|uniref:Tf2-1-like SH3-like domain-containing protein n=1 Tax=Paspalum notatum var. saurae TaxID=547442 RepID=A0AAQ3SL22_PASNO